MRQVASPNSLLPSPGGLDLLRPESQRGVDGGGGGAGAKPGLSIALPMSGAPFAGSIPSPGLMAMADAAEASNEAATALGSFHLLQCLCKVKNCP